MHAKIRRRRLQRKKKADTRDWGRITEKEISLLSHAESSHGIPSGLLVSHTQETTSKNLASLFASSLIQERRTLSFICLFISSDSRMQRLDLHFPSLISHANSKEIGSPGSSLLSHATGINPSRTFHSPSFEQQLGRLPSYGLQTPSPPWLHACRPSCTLKPTSFNTSLEKIDIYAGNSSRADLPSSCHPFSPLPVLCSRKHKSSHDFPSYSLLSVQQEASCPLLT